VELLKQPLNSPMPVEEQVVSVFAGTNGFLDDLPVADVRPFESELLEHMRSSHGGLMDEIKSSGLPDSLGDVIGAFKASFETSDGSSNPQDPTATDEGEMGEAESAKTLATE
ncbi:MAG: F0F1 ATP synthase subunit alpha, partial [Actinomycetota bacterium]